MLNTIFIYILAAFLQLFSSRFLACTPAIFFTMNEHSISYKKKKRRKKIEKIKKNCTHCVASNLIINKFLPSNFMRQKDGIFAGKQQICCCTAYWRNFVAILVFYAIFLGILILVKFGDSYGYSLNFNYKQKCS